MFHVFSIKPRKQNSHLLESGVPVVGLRHSVISAGQEDGELRNLGRYICGLVFLWPWLSARAAHTDHVSVIMPVFRCTQYLPESIGSVLAQTHPNWTLYTVNDGPDDEGEKVLRDFARRDSRVRVIQLPQNLGIAQARNQALTSAYKEHPGDYISFLDCDDWLAPQKLQRQIQFMRAGRVAFSFTSFQAWDGEKDLVSKPFQVWPRVRREDLLYYNRIHTGTVMLDTQLVGEVFMPPYTDGMDDIRLWLRITDRGFDAHGLNENLALYRIRAGSKSRDKSRMAAARLRVLQEQGLSTPSIVLRMLVYAGVGVWRQKVTFRRNIPCPFFVAREGFGY
jgi:teichuronic acid biosynthesis glycosyltransferase TuaG